MTTAYLPVPVPRKGRRKHLTLDEWRRLLGAAQDRGERDHLLVRLLYECAMRAAEPGQLRLDHLKRLDQRELWVPRGKGSSNAWVEITLELARLLDAWVCAWHQLPVGGTVPLARLRPDLFAFPGERGATRRQAGLTRQTVYNIVRACGRAAGLEESLQHPHAIKHARAQHLFEAAEAEGLDPRDAIKVIAAVTGHKSAETAWLYYTHITGRGRAMAARVLHDALGTEEPST